MAKIVRSPELRYTQDTQTPIAHMLVEFDGLPPDETPATLRVVGWGNMASEIQEKYQEGDRVILVGRLSMNTIDRPEGFKEKRAELTLSHIYPVDGSQVASPSRAAAPPSDKVVPVESFKPTVKEYYQADIEASPHPQPTETAAVTPKPASPSAAQNLDDIPFVRPVSLRTREVDLQDSWELEANRPGIWLHGARDLWLLWL